MYEVLKDFAGPAATMIAAIAAGFIAYRLGQAQATAAQSQAATAKRSWETANERVVLDLFERRIAIFESIRSVVSSILRTGQPTHDDYFAYLQAIDRVQFYFGDEVQEYIEHIRLLIGELQLDATIIADHADPDRSARIRGRADRMKELSGFYENAKRLFGPYIRAHQKVIAPEQLPA